jgi:HSP20 family molecular chaperone IbpA
MRARDLSNWMWGDALSLLERAERLHRRFLPALAPAAQAWEPPVDIFEDETCLVIQVALPGVPAHAVEVALEPGAVRIVGQRSFPALGALHIHRIEIPYGRFERRIALPVHALGAAQRELADGCLWITFRKRKDLP